jgi:hypothetical protein
LATTRYFSIDELSPTFIIIGRALFCNPNLVAEVAAELNFATNSAVEEHRKADI